MKRKLGISIYPSNQSFKEMTDYIDKAHKYGFTRIFSSLLEIPNGDKKKVESKYKKIFKYASDLGFNICLDVNPDIFKDLKISPSDLSFFNKIYVNTIRLDSPFDSKTEAEMTFNPYGMDIEVNISNFTSYIDNIKKYKPITDRLVGCHNFYPQVNSGLDFNFFLESSKYAKSKGIRTAAFVSSSQGKIGPWPTNDGLPTLEMHRTLPIQTQAKHLWATGHIDDIIIGNANASEQELKLLSEISMYKIELDVKFQKETSKLEKDIVLNFSHFRRGDINSYTIRSTMSRVVYKDEDFKPHNNDLEQEKGNIYIGNNNFKNYKGELQLVLQNIETDNRKNLVAKVVDHEKFLIDYITPWQKFKFKEVKK